MTPGDTFMIECPDCGKVLKRGTLGSGNLFGAVPWTDGYLQAPGLPFISPVAQCRACGHVFWWRDAKVIAQWQFGSLPQGKDAYRWEAEPELPLRVDEATNIALAERSETRQRQVLLRTHGWWASNDPFREPHEGERPQRASSSIDNMRCLIELLHPANPRERLSMAELSRELGDFDAATELIGGWMPAELRSWAGVVYGQISERDVHVAKVPVDEGFATGPPLEGDVAPPPPVAEIVLSSQSPPAVPTPEPALVLSPPHRPNGVALPRPSPPEPPPPGEVSRPLVLRHAIEIAETRDVEVMLSCALYWSFEIWSCTWNERRRQLNVITTRSGEVLMTVRDEWNGRQLALDASALDALGRIMSEEPSFRPDGSYAFCRTLHELLAATGGWVATPGFKETAARRAEARDDAELVRRLDAFLTPYCQGPQWSERGQRWQLRFHQMVADGSVERWTLIGEELAVRSATGFQVEIAGTYYGGLVPAKHL